MVHFHRFEIAKGKNYSEKDIHVRRVISGRVDRWVKDGSSPPTPAAKCILTLKSNLGKRFFVVAENTRFCTICASICISLVHIFVADICWPGIFWQDFFFAQMEEGWKCIPALKTTSLFHICVFLICINWFWSFICDYILIFRFQFRVYYRQMKMGPFHQVKWMHRRALKCDFWPKLMHLAPHYICNRCQWRLNFLLVQYI